MPNFPPIWCKAKRPLPASDPFPVTHAWRTWTTELKNTRYACKPRGGSECFTRFYQTSMHYSPFISPVLSSDPKFPISPSAVRNSCSVSDSWPLHLYSGESDSMKWSKSANRWVEVRRFGGNWYRGASLVTSDSETSCALSSLESLRDLNLLCFAGTRILEKIHF